MRTWRGTLLFAAALTACGSSDPGFAPLAPLDVDGGWPEGGRPPDGPMVTPGNKDGGPGSDGDPEFDADDVSVLVYTDTGNHGFLHARNLPEGRTMVHGRADSGWITTDGRLVLEQGDQVLELVCDTPCQLDVEDEAVATDPFANDAPVATLGCGALVVSREDEVWSSCGEQLFTTSEDEVMTASGALLSVHDDRIALVASATRLSLQDLNSGELTELDDSELHARVEEIAPRHVRTTADGFWVLVSDPNGVEEAVRYSVSLTGGITRDGTYISLKLAQTDWALGPGTLAADGTMYKILHYMNNSTGFMNYGLIRLELDAVPTVDGNLLIDTGDPDPEFERLDLLVSGP
jgi:hypothetical protein